MAWLPMTWAYVAGFFDGEGCVDCREKKNGTGASFQFRLKLYQNERAVLDAIHDFLAAEGIPSVVEVHARPDRISAGHAGSFALVVNRVLNVYKMLDAMQPYLIVKQKEAIEVTNMIEDRINAIMEGEITDGRTLRAYEGVI